jgi:hypothetical protein
VSVDDGTAGRWGSWPESLDEGKVGFQGFRSPQDLARRWMQVVRDAKKFVKNLALRCDRCRSTDMDLVCLIDNKEAALHASDLVAMIGDLLERG